jgi:hypothetical protein
MPLRPRPWTSPKATCVDPLCEGLSLSRGRRSHHAQKEHVGTWEISRLAGRVCCAPVRMWKAMSRSGGVDGAKGGGRGKCGLAKHAPNTVSDRRVTGTGPHTVGRPQRLTVKYPRWEPDAGNPPVRLCVQRRLACSAGDKPAGARVRGPVAWIAERRETEFLKPIDDPLLGRGASYRAVMQMNVDVASEVRSSEGRARNREGEGSMDSRNLTDAVISLRRGGSDGTMTRTC